MTIANSLPPIDASDAFWETWGPWSGAALGGAAACCALFGTPALVTAILSAAGAVFTAIGVRATAAVAKQRDHRLRHVLAQAVAAQQEAGAAKTMAILGW